MAESRWIPKWEMRKITDRNNTYEVCYDTVSKLYACPLCSPVCKKGGIPNEGSYFIGPEDTIYHLRAHATEPWKRKEKRTTEEREEEEEAEEGEEDD